ncbi:MAG: hypothetical protein H7A23_06030 [Leptospiraceae bacterium]|nr:hypothetical protein [Leptospiraceae bacterium]MCP5494097.1 hypothetical protein [Leptospiraceae bacterium]
MKFRYFLYFFQVLLLLLLVSEIYPQEDSLSNRLNFSGSIRVRGFQLGRDILLKRETPTDPYDAKVYKQEKETYYGETLIQEEIDARLAGKKTNITKKKESLNYFDTRALLNLEFKGSKNLSGVWGVMAGDVRFGGMGLSKEDRNSPYLVGAGSGGEMGYASGTNLLTNFIYLDYHLKEKNFYSRGGLQLFSSARGMVMFNTGLGILANKDIRFLNMNLEGGWIRPRDRTFIDKDNNGYNDKSNVNIDVVFGKVKLLLKKVKSEIYTYYSRDNDPTDVSSETGSLYWHGFYNEYNSSNFSVIVHGVYNHGRVKTFNPYRDSSGNKIYEKYDPHTIKGGLYDLEFSYIFNLFNNKANVNLLAVGTTGRPGYENDGVQSSYRGNGYRTLFPRYTISNIAVDFTGGYSIFSAQNMSGLGEYGVYTNFIAFGPMQITLGYYLLYANKSPHIGNNVEFNLDNYKKTRTYFGQEYNFNLRWNIQKDFQIVFRSGYFTAGDGLKALFDTIYGKKVIEAFISSEYSF